jgi:hypothetical protein
MRCLSALLELPSRHICRSCCRLPSTAERTWGMLLALRLLPPSFDRTIATQRAAASLPPPVQPCRLFTQQHPPIWLIGFMMTSDDTGLRGQLPVRAGVEGTLFGYRCSTHPSTPEIAEVRAIISSPATLFNVAVVTLRLVLFYQLQWALFDVGLGLKRANCDIPRFGHVEWSLPTRAPHPSEPAYCINQRGDCVLTTNCGI